MGTLGAAHVLRKGAAGGLSEAVAHLTPGNGHKVGVASISSAALSPVGPNDPTREDFGVAPTRCVAWLEAANGEASPADGGSCRLRRRPGA